MAERSGRETMAESLRKKPKIPDRYGFFKNPGFFRFLSSD